MQQTTHSLQIEKKITLVTVDVNVTVEAEMDPETGRGELWGKET